MSVQCSGRFLGFGSNAIAVILRCSCGRVTPSREAGYWLFTLGERHVASLRRQKITVRREQCAILILTGTPRQQTLLSW